MFRSSRHDALVFLCVAVVAAVAPAVSAPRHASWCWRACVRMLAHSLERILQPLCKKASAAGRPRLLSCAVARDWEPPALNTLHGAAKKADRNSDDGKPVVWFCLANGVSSLGAELIGRSFDVVERAWQQLAAQEYERRTETEVRLYDRTDAAWEREGE